MTTYSGVSVLISKSINKGFVSTIEDTNSNKNQEAAFSPFYSDLI
jgi:hypothetical protein